jgi:fibronectin-binding autotransporter adhesin
MKQLPIRNHRPHFLSVLRLSAVFLRRVAIFAALLFCAAALPQAVMAGDKTWTGAVNSNFSNAGNWSGGTPVAGDDLIFPVAATRFTATNDFSPNREFKSLWFQGSTYVIGGNPIQITTGRPCQQALPGGTVLSCGISSTNSSGTNTINADVDVRASHAWEATGPMAFLDINGNINLNANTLTVSAITGDFFFSGIVSGSGNIVKLGVGTLRLDGSAANTYAGYTQFDVGVLELAKPSGVTAIPGSLTVGDGNGLLLTDVLRLLADDQIADTSDVTVKNSARWDLADHQEHIGALTMQGGTIDTGTGKLFLGGNLTTLSDSNTATINGSLSLGGTTRTFEVNAGPPAADLRINAALSSDNLITGSGFTKTGGGSLFLAGTNSYNGATTINAGQVALLSAGALGAITTPLGAPAGVVVNNATGNLFLSGVQVTNESLTINSANPGGAFNASGASLWTGDIVLNTDTFIASSGTLQLSGPITGTGGFTKLSTGSLTLGGTTANTYTGTTTVRDGTLLLDKDTATAIDGAMSGPLVVGENELPENTDIVRWLRASQVPDDTDITLNSSGLADLNGFGENVRHLSFNGGDVNTQSAGSILPTGDITVHPNTNSQAIISGRMSVLSSPIIDVTGHFFSPDLKLDAQLHGAGGLTKNGPGEISLTAANTYPGLTTVNEGFLMVDHSSGLGTSAAGTVVNSGVLGLRFGVTVTDESLTLAGTGQSGFGALDSSLGSNTWTGNITLSGDATVSVNAGDFLNLSGAIGGGFNLTKTGTGPLLFEGGAGNTFNNMIVNAGTLELNKTLSNAAFAGNLTIGDGSGTDTVRLLAADQIPDTATVTMAAGAVFDLNSQLETTGSISGFGQISLGTGTLQAGTDNGSSIFSGQIIGTGPVFKLGTGTWTLDSNNTYTGATTVSAGMLVVNGSQPGSAVTVNDTARLGGDGVIGNLSVFGALRPGSSPGMLTTGNVVFQSSAADFHVELNGTTPGPGYDQVKALGTVTLANAALHPTLGFAPGSHSSFTIIDNDGSDPVANTFTGLAEGAALTIGGVPFQISYTGGTGNDVTLTARMTSLEAWRLLHFGTIENSGDAADDFDFEKDGLVNLLEFAFGLDPKQNSTGQLPQGRTIGSNMEMSFTQPAGVSGITYGAEWSSALSSNPADWTDIPDSDPSLTGFNFSVPIGSNTRVFMRATVTNP